MEESQSVKPLYIVISQTGTVLSRILRMLTRKEYNHASISLARDLHIMYSFGRKNPYNPFFGGFVRESASFGTFKRFSNTKIIVIKVDVSQNEYNAIRRLIDEMVSAPQVYGYNYLGLCLAAFKICFRSDNRYYCSEFVRDVLVKSGVNGADKLNAIIHPMHFLEMPNTETVYRGKLSDYCVREEIAV